VRHVRQTNIKAINRLIAVSPGSNIYRTNKALIDITGPIKWGHNQDNIMSKVKYVILSKVYFYSLNRLFRKDSIFETKLGPTFLYKCCLGVALRE
jgi:hypothetical protein